MKKCKSPCNCGSSGRPPPQPPPCVRYRKTPRKQRHHDAPAHPGRPCTGFRSAFTFQDLFLTFLLLFSTSFGIVWAVVVPRFVCGCVCARRLALVCACSVVERPPLFSGRPAGIPCRFAIFYGNLFPPGKCPHIMHMLPVPLQKPATPATGFGGFFHRPGLY